MSDALDECMTARMLRLGGGFSVSFCEKQRRVADMFYVVDHICIFFLAVRAMSGWRLIRV